MASAPLAFAALTTASMLRYEARGSAGPISRDSSATRTCSAWRSASEHTATLRTSIARSVRAMRQAISPRLAIRTLRNIARGAGGRGAGARSRRGVGLRRGRRGRRRAALGHVGRPAWTALLEEGGEPFLGLIARAHFGEHARQGRTVLLPGRVGPQLEQRLDASLRVRRPGEQGGDALIDLGIQLGGRDHVVHQTVAVRGRGVEALAGKHQLAGAAVAEAADD